MRRLAFVLIALWAVAPARAADAPGRIHRVILPFALPIRVIILFGFAGGGLRFAAQFICPRTAGGVPRAGRGLIGQPIGRLPILAFLPRTLGGLLPLLAGLRLVALTAGLLTGLLPWLLAGLALIARLAFLPRLIGLTRLALFAGLTWLVLLRLLLAGFTRLADLLCRLLHILCRLI